MSFGCGIKATRLNNRGQSKKTSMPGDKACAEFGIERESMTTNLDPTRSANNEYHFPDGCGDSGEKLWAWFVGKLAEKNVARKAEGKRALSSLTNPAAGFIVTPDEEAVATWDAETRDRFCEDTIASLAVWLGHPPDAWAKHVDEGGMRDRGLTRSDELGDEGLHLHAADRMLDENGEYKMDKTMSRARIKELHRVFVEEMQKRGWDIEVHKSKEEHEKDGDPERLPAGMSANKYKGLSKWKRAVDAKEKAANEKDAAAEQKSRAAEQKSAEAEQKSAAADEKMSVAEQKSAEADKKTRKVVEDRVAVDRDRAKLAIERDGYTPPKDVIPMTPEPELDTMGMPAPVRDAWERWKSEPSVANGDAVKAAVKSSVPVAEGRRAAIDREGIYLVREEDVENFRRAWAADVDPMASHGGLAERERAVAAGERALAEREAAVQKAEEEIEPKCKAVKDREDAVSDREDAADRRDKALDARENAVKADANGNAATKRALDRRKKELDEQANAQKSTQAKLDNRSAKLDARERKIETSESDAQGIRDRANVYARLRVEQADEAAGETRFERLRKNPLKVFAHQLATLSDGLYAGGHSIAGRLASELGDVLDRMGEGFGKRLNDLLRRGLDEALMPEPTGADVTLEQMAHKNAPVRPANPQAWAAAGRYTDADAHVEGLDPDEPYDPYAIRDSGRDDDTIQYYG